MSTKLSLKERLQTSPIRVFGLDCPQTLLMSSIWSHFIVLHVFQFSIFIMFQGFVNIHVTVCRGNLEK